jgi:uncharacterized protein (TIGR00255 family)
MTAFARVEAGNVSWEVRSVNHRFLDAAFKIPERYRSFEPELRSMLRGELGRGKIDCFLRVEQDSQEGCCRSNPKDHGYTTCTEHT